MGASNVRNLYVEQDKKMGEVVQLFPEPEPEKKTSMRFRLDGQPKQTPSNGKKGDPHEVYGFRKKEELDAMIQYFIKEKTNAVSYCEKEQAGRDLMLFVVGINLSLRPSDLLKLEWTDIFDNNGEYLDYTRKQEGKTKKFKNVSFNQGVKNAIDKYVSEFKPNIHSNACLFRSQKGGNIKARRLSEIIQNAAEECGIHYRVGSYSLRKSFGYWFIKNNNNDMTALAKLQELFKHDSPATTLRYIGLTDEETKKYYESSILGMY